LETCAWSEQIDDLSIDSRLWPRALAAAERFWSPANINNTNAATIRMERTRCILARRGIRAGPMVEGYYYYCDEDDDFSAEEIFNIFFGHGGPTTRVYRRRQQPNSYHFTTHSTQNTTHTLVQLLPYLFLFLISILGTLFIGDPQFQLHRTGKYTTLRTIRSSNVEYYVKPDFRPPRTDAELNKLESSVIDEYVSDLRQQCYREKQYKESLMWRARMMNDDNLYRQATTNNTILR